MNKLYNFAVKSEIENKINLLLARYVKDNACKLNDLLAVMLRNRAETSKESNEEFTEASKQFNAIHFCTMNLIKFTKEFLQEIEKDTK